MREITLILCCAFAATALTLMLRGPNVHCPAPSPRSVEALFAPCQMAAAQADHVVPKTALPTTLAFHR